MKRAHIVGMIFLCTSLARSQTFTQDQIRDDLVQLSEKIRAYNPGLTIYNPLFDQKADSVINNLKQSYDKYESYTLISQICGFSNEGHFEIGQWTDNVRSEILNDSIPFLPFSVMIVDQEIYVNGDYSDEGLLIRGDRVDEINGKTSEDILEMLQSVTPSDGGIATYQYKKIEDNFPWFYHFYVEQSESYELVLLRNGEEVQQEVKALTKTERQTNARSRSTATSVEASIDDVYELKLESEYAYLHLKSFDFRLVEKYELKADDFYREIFQKVNAHGASHLIIDLRGNTGGRKAFGEGILPFVASDDPGVPFIIKTTSWKGKVKTIKKFKTSNDAFNGKIYVLVDGYTYSVGGIIARYLQEFSDAVMIGEETGTRYEGFVAGSKQYTTLKHTNIRIGVPCYLKEFPRSTIQSTSNKGLLPQHEIKVSLQDRLEKRDPVKDFALNLVKENSQ